MDHTGDRSSQRCVELSLDPNSSIETMKLVQVYVLTLAQLRMSSANLVSTIADQMPSTRAVKKHGCYDVTVTMTKESQVLDASWQVGTRKKQPLDKSADDRSCVKSLWKTQSNLSQQGVEREATEVNRVQPARRVLSTPCEGLCRLARGRTMCEG